MGKVCEHLHLAVTNNKTLEVLEQSHCMGHHWMVFSAFYRALHLVEAVLCTNFDHHSNNHDDRIKGFVQLGSRGKSLYQAYAKLFHLKSQSEMIQETGANLFSNEFWKEVNERTPSASVYWQWLKIVERFADQEKASEKTYLCPMPSGTNEICPLLNGGRIICPSGIVKRDVSIKDQVE